MFKKILLVNLLFALATTMTFAQKHFGEKINKRKSISYDKLLGQIATQDTVYAKVKGTVDAVCQVKGCWMTIVAPDKEEMFVQFEDYGFFMPLDISGRQVVMDGYAYRDITSVADLKHYAEDEGKSQAEIDAITEPEEELKFLATGVLLLKKRK